MDRCKLEIFYILRIVDWNWWPNVQRYAAGVKIDTIPFPATPSTEWTLELRFQKTTLLQEGILNFLNWLKIDG